MEAFLPEIWQVDGLSLVINDPTQYQLDGIPRVVTLLEFFFNRKLVLDIGGSMAWCNSHYTQWRWGYQATPIKAFTTTSTYLIGSAWRGSDGSL